MPTLPKTIRDLWVSSPTRFYNEATEAQRQDFLMTRPDHHAVYAESQYCLVAEDDGSIVGFLFALPLLPDVLIIDGVGVVQVMRREGVARQMYSALLERAREGGVRRIQASISLDNPASMALHESLGFALRDRKEAVLELRP